MSAANKACQQLVKHVRVGAPQHLLHLYNLLSNLNMKSLIDELMTDP